MKRLYKAPRIKVIDGVCEPLLTRASQDIQSIDNNPNNGGSTLGTTTGINYGEEITGGGNLNEGDLDD